LTTAPNDRFHSVALVVLAFDERHTVGRRSSALARFNEISKQRRLPAELRTSAAMRNIASGIGLAPALLGAI